MIKLEHITKHFTDGNQDVHALTDVSLEIAEGEIYGIIGFSGAGKSTLIRCINLLERPTSGKVYINDEDITALAPTDLRKTRKKIGMIFQHFNLMPSRTVFDNIAFPLHKSALTKEEKTKKIKELLELVDIADKGEMYPSQLSGGQKQRVAIARALASEPKILLCDEATSALDPQTTDSILELLKELNKKLGITIVLITHEMSVIKKICDKVAVLEQGRLIEYGEVYSIFADPKEKLTRDFIKTTSNLYHVDALIKANSPLLDLKECSVLARLAYIHKNISEPLISIASRNFDVSFNIIYADVEIVQGAPIGGTVAIIKGEKENIKKAIEYMSENHVKVEVLKDGTTTA